MRLNTERGLLLEGELLPESGGKRASGAEEAPTGPGALVPRVARGEPFPLRRDSPSLPLPRVAPSQGDGSRRGGAGCSPWDSLRPRVRPPPLPSGLRHRGALPSEGTGKPFPPLHEASEEGGVACGP